MRVTACVAALALCFMLAACGNLNGSDGSVSGEPDKRIVSGDDKKMFEQISAEEAKIIMDSKADIVILDVREQEEYDAGHIPGAVLIPYTQIEQEAESVLPDKDAQILVYCRSGRRSKIAAKALSELGYSNVKEFGGIIDWSYALEK